MTSKSVDFFSAAATPLALLDPSRRLSKANDAFTSLFKEGGGIDGEPISDLVDAHDRARLGEILDTLVAGRAARLTLQLDGARVRTPGKATVEVSRTADGHFALVLLAGEAAADEQIAARCHAFQRVIDEASALIWMVDAEGVCTFAGGRALETLALDADAMVGLNLLEMFHENPDIAGSIVRALGGEIVSATTSPVAGVRFETWYVPLRGEGNDPSAEVTGAAVFAVDVSNHASTGDAVRSRLDLIERQSAAIRALATPIIEVWEQVLCLPVIGTVDSARTSEMMEGLLKAIARRQARYAIVDLTGVEIVDSSTADHLIRLFRAAHVLGVEGILCGIRPAVANTVVSLGLDLGSIRMMRSLKEALRWCIRERDRRLAAMTEVATGGGES